MNYNIRIAIAENPVSHVKPQHQLEKINEMLGFNYMQKYPAT